MVIVAKYLLIMWLPLIKVLPSNSLKLLESKPFTFLENTSLGVPNDTINVASRQLITGTVPAIISTGNTCVCVPPGQCSGTIPNPPTDGTGLIDIRIVNNPSQLPPVNVCNYGLVNCCQAGTYRCGMRYGPPPGSRPASPGQADFGEYPWQAAILTTADVYIGSGALINSRHVLTAAHKVFNLTTNSFKVRLGEWDASATTEPIPAENVDVTRVFIHPNFNQNNLQNDIAIIRLSTEINLTQKSTIATVCLPSLPLYVGQRCFVAGWGRDDFGPSGSFQAILKEVDVPVISNVDCQISLRQTRLGATFILNDSSFMCAGGELGKDACTGDGGSPLVCLNNGLWQVVGLAAWGIGCGAVGSPGVYVNVATYLPWVQTVLATV